MYSWRGRPMRQAGSATIPRQFPTQPTVPRTPNLPVYTQPGTPEQLYTAPGMRLGRPRRPYIGPPGREYVGVSKRA